MKAILKEFFPDMICEGISAGIKHNGAKDLGLIYVPSCTAAAAVFTQHAFAAPSVEITREHLKTMLPKAIIVNSGCANACMGAQGLADAQFMVESIAKCLDLQTEEVLLAQTGMIGTALDREVLSKGFAELAKACESSAQNIDHFAEAILTTDTCTKISARRFDEKAFVLGVTKGAGMIAPNMATTLTFMITNVAIDSKALQNCLQEAIDHSYNKASVDTDTSTNDMVIILSTGDVQASGTAFQEALSHCCLDLMSQLLLDAEGAQKMIVASVLGAESDDLADTLAAAVVRSPLVKSMVAGEMLNWGRILMAIGKGGHALHLDKISVSMQDQIIFRRGQEVACDDIDFSAQLIEIAIDLGMGDATGIAYGCDMHEAYVTINKDKS